jgi:hypothetical protein
LSLEFFVPLDFAMPRSCLPIDCVGYESFASLTSSVDVEIGAFVIASIVRTLGLTLGLTSLGFALCKL